MKIVHLRAENIKRLVAVEVTPEGHVVRVTGRNGQGKSSLLDAIWFALGGREALPSKPIRAGADKASVVLDLGDYRVERRFTETDSYLYVTSTKDGAKYPSPQKLLDGLIGAYTFDPLAFCRQDAKTQGATLRRLVGLDTTALDVERRKLYDERTEANRAAKQLKAQIDAAPWHAEIGTELVDVSALSAELTQAHEHNRRVVEAARTADQLADLVDRLREQLRDAEARLKAANKAVLDAGEETDTESMARELAEVAETNRKVEQNRQRERLWAQHEAAEARAGELDRRIDAIDEQKADLLAAAAFPLDELSIGDDGEITYQGIPLAQASSAEQLRVSLAIAMALNPKLRVIRITDGSLLDSSSFAMIEALAKDQDYQVWVEVVDESGDVGIVIEDGRVKGAAEVAA